MGESEIVHLQCPDYLNLLSAGIRRLFETRLSTDLLVRCVNGDQQPLKVHQTILSIFCPQLCQGINNSTHEITVQTDCEIFNLLLQFVYLGQVNVNRCSIDRLRMCAEELGYQQLVDVTSNISGNFNSNLNAAECEENADLNGENTVLSPKIDNYQLNIETNQVINTFKSCNYAEISPNTAEIITTECSKITCSADADVFAGCSAENNHVDVTDCPNVILEISNKKCKNGRKITLSSDSVTKEPFKCSQCDYVTSRKDSYRNHLDIHNEQREYVCEVCTRRFRNCRRFKTHVRSHKHPERMLKCERCEYSTSTRTTLIQHLASRHHVDAQGNPLTADVKCAECDFVCVSKFQLRNHRLYKHSIKPFKCAECEFSAVRKTLVEKHMLMKHKNLRPFLCDTCGFRSKTISAFHSHMMVHSTNKPFKCDSCPKAYKHNYQLRAHQRSHIGNGKPFLCHICCMAFRRNYEMQVHIKQKHGDDADVAHATRTNQP